MTSGIRWKVICFASGCACALQFSLLPASQWQLAITIFCASGWLLALWQPLFYTPACFLLGVLWTLTYSQLQLQSYWPDELAKSVVIASGTISSLPERKNHRTRFLFTVDAIQDLQGRSLPDPGKVRLNWYRNAPDLVPEERWQLKIKLRPAYGFANPGGFNYETWLFSRSIRATGYVQSGTRLTTANRFSILSLRYHLSAHLETVLPATAQRGLIRALTLGDRSEVSSEQWNILRRTGSGHLLAISGLHIGLIALFGFFVGGHLWALLPVLTNYFPARQMAAIFAILCAATYATLAGFTLPTQRALIMLCLSLAGIFLGKRWRISSLLLITLGIVLCIHPTSLLAADFWLSFSAVCLILWLYCCRYAILSQRKKWLHNSMSQFLIAIGLFPLVALWFQEVATYAGLVNIVAIPVVGFLVVPLVFSACLCSLFSPVIATILFTLADGLLQKLFQLLHWFQALPAATQIFSTPGGFIDTAVAGAGIGLLLMPRGIPGRWFGIFLLTPVCFPSYPLPAPGNFHFYLLDVGQGLSAVIRTRQHVLVYDSGDRWNADFDAGRSVIIPFLRHLGSNRIDTLILSHSDRDHIGGSESLLQAYPVEKIIGHKPENIRQSKSIPCKRGDNWQWDGVIFELLHPPVQKLAAIDNNHSCVLAVRQPGMSVLLTGDIEAIAETQLLHYGDRTALRAEVLLVPHHGSKSSSTPAFLRAVNPEIALFATGYKNRFNLPAANIIQRYHTAGIAMYSSAGSGTIKIYKQADTIRVEEYRQKYRRFWLMPPHRPGTRL